jgi:hypothetical protein
LIPDDDWCLYRFDPASYINSFFRKEFSGVGNVTSENLVLRDIILCPNILVKGIYITNTLYSRENLPKEIIAIRQNDEVNLRYIEIPEGEEIIQEDLEEEKDVVRTSPKKTYSKKVFQEKFDESLNEIEKRSISNEKTRKRIRENRK